MLWISVLPRKVKEYSDMLMKKIKKHNCNVFLVNTGMDKSGKRFDLEFTRNTIKQAILTEYPLEDNSEEVLKKLENMIDLN